MLAARNRLSNSADFTAVTRRGHRSRCGGLVVFVLPDVPGTVTAPDSGASASPVSGAASARFGLIVGRTVGNSVVRHEVSRRLRHQLRDRIERVPAGSRVVVRALPEASSESSARLGADLDCAFDKLDRTLARSSRNDVRS